MFNKDFKKFLKLTDEQKLVLLKSLDYDLDAESFIIDYKNNKVICPYSKRPVRFKDASILPGSTVIINTSLITLSEYISDYLESDEEFLDGILSQCLHRKKVFHQIFSIIWST